MQRTALVWLVYTLTNSPFYVGLIGVAQFLPMMLFTLFAGAVVDRFPKRRILLVTQTAYMLQAFALTLLAWRGNAHYWQLLLLCALLGITTTVDMPARFSYLVELVGRKDIVNAVSLNSTIVNLARIIGPAAAGLVMTHFGAPLCFLLNAISFLAVLYSLTRITSEEQPEPAKNKSVLKEVREGLLYIKNDPILRTDAVFLAVLCTFAMNVEVIVPVFAKTVLHLGAGAYTELLSAAGAGSLLGAVAMAAISAKGVRKGAFILGAASSIGAQLMMTAAVFTESRELSLFIVAAIGFSNLVFLNAGNAIFQVNVPNQYRGRVMSVYSFLTQGSTPIGNFFAGSVMQAAGGWAGFPACGLACVLCLWHFVKKHRALIAEWLKKPQPEAKKG